MKLHYKIVEVWPEDQLIVVRYWTDAITEEYLNSNKEDLNRREDGSPIRCRSDLALSLPIPTPNDNDLERFIVRNAPIAFLKTLEDVLNPEIDTSLANIVAMKDKQFTKENVEEVLNPETKELTEAEIEELINSISTK